MSMQRTFHSRDFLQPSTGEPIRSVVTTTPETVVVAWHVAQGQRIAAHVHPHGQDTWTILSGQGEYLINESGATLPLVAGDIAVAPIGHVHGVYNPHPDPLIFISVVTPAEAGYEPLDPQPAYSM